MPQRPSDDLPHQRSTAGQRLLPIVCCLSILFPLVYSVRYANVPTYGFAAYYGFSKLLLERRFSGVAYDFEYFNAQLRRFGFGSVVDAPNNLPTGAVAFVPLAFLSPPAAKLTWTILSGLLYIASIRILLRINDIPWKSELGLAGISLACLWRPSLENIALGQFYIVLLFLFCLSMDGLVTNRALRLSLPISFAIVFKGYGLINASWLLLNKRWKSVLIIVAVVFAVVVVTLPLLGADVWSAYVSKVTSTFGTSPKSGHVAYQTLGSVLMHLFLYDPRWLPSPMVVLPHEAVRILILVLSAAVIWFTMISGKRTNANEDLLSYSTALGATVITAPFAEEYHYVLFLPLVFAVLKRILPAGRRLVRFRSWEILSFLSIVVLAVPLPYKRLQPAFFPWYLFAYPKLYAGAILLASSVFWRRSQREVDPVDKMR